MCVCAAQHSGVVFFKLTPKAAYQTRVSTSYWVSSEAADCICGVSTSSRCPECVSQTVSIGTRLDDNSGLVCRRQRGLWVSP